MLEGNYSLSLSFKSQLPQDNFSLVNRQADCELALPEAQNHLYVFQKEPECKKHIHVLQKPKAAETGHKLLSIWGFHQVIDSLSVVQDLVCNPSYCVD